MPSRPMTNSANRARRGDMTFPPWNVGRWPLRIPQAANSAIDRFAPPESMAVLARPRLASRRRGRYAGGAATLPFLFLNSHDTQAVHRQVEKGRPLRAERLPRGGIRPLGAHAVKIVYDKETDTLS